jgi:O-antigen/teichoic acid export membrane protein
MAIVSSGFDRPSTVSRLLTGTATRYVLLAVNIGLGVFLMPFTIRHLGQTEYGLWMMVASLTYYFQLLDLGYGSSVVKQVTEADARGDVSRVNRILSTFVVVYGVLGAVAALGIVATIFIVVPRFPNLEPSQVHDARLLLAIMGVRVAIGFPMSVFGAAAQARQRFALNNSVAIVIALLNGAITYVVLASGYGVVALVGSTTAVSLLGYIAYAWTAKIALPEMSLRWSWFSRGLVREVTSISIYFFLIDIAIQVGFNLDNLVVGGFIGTAAVAVYSVAMRLADYQRQLASQFNALLFPVIVRFGSAGRSDALREMLVEGTTVALGLIVGVTICTVGFAEPLIRLWMGPGFEQSVPTLYVLAVTSIVLVAQGPMGSVLLGTGRHRIVALISVGDAVLNLGLSLVLVRTLGMIGVAVGTGIPVLLLNVLVILPLSCRAVGVPVLDFLRAAVRPSVAGAIPATALCVALRVAAPPESIAAVIGEGALVGIAYVGGLIAFGFTSEMRAVYASRLMRLRAARLAQ